MSKLSTCLMILSILSILGCGVAFELELRSVGASLYVLSAFGIMALVASVL